MVEKVSTSKSSRNQYYEQIEVEYLMRENRRRRIWNQS